MLKEVEHSGAVVNSVPSQQKKKKDLAFKAGGLGLFCVEFMFSLCLN